MKQLWTCSVWSTTGSVSSSTTITAGQKRGETPPLDEGCRGAQRCGKRRDACLAYHLHLSLPIVGRRFKRGTCGSGPHRGVVTMNTRSKAPPGLPLGRPPAASGAVWRRKLALEATLCHVQHGASSAQVTVDVDVIAAPPTRDAEDSKASSCVYPPVQILLTLDLRSGPFTSRRHVAFP